MLRRLFTSINSKLSYFQAALPRNLASAVGNGSRPVIIEDDLAVSLKTHFPKATFIQVHDVSGGCGAMFEVSIESTEFKGLPIVKQHRLVTTALKDLIKDMHGIRIQTSVPSS